MSIDPWTGKRILAIKECDCGSKQERYPLVDARGIFCAFVCDACINKKRSEFRADIFTNSQYLTTEPVDDEDYEI